MLNKNRVQVKPLLVLISLNLLYLLFVVTDVIEGIFSLWIFVLFISLTPILLKDRRNIIAVIVFLIPFEITKAVIPIFQTVEMSNGVFNSVFDIARLFMLYSFVLWFLTDLKSFIPFIKHKITYTLAIFILYYILSTVFISPEMGKGLNETLRYVIYFLFFTMIIQFIKKPDDYILILKVLIVVAVLLSLEAICEYLFDYSLWRDVGRRASATFHDPNIFARFLDIVIVALLILRLKKIYIIKPQFLDISLLICGTALMLTVSRQGWFILFATMFFISFFLEKKIRNKIMIGLIIISFISIPILFKLLEAREHGLELYDIGTRAGLLLGGGLMFLSNPISGIGAAGFQTVMIDKYLGLLTWGIHGATLSHTYIVTILAELGIIGITVFCALLLFVYKQFRNNYRVKDELFKTLSLITFAAFIVILVGSQAEGRFFEEPLLWLFLGLNMALEKMKKEENEK